jgi:hypothetical protein
MYTAKVGDIIKQVGGSHCIMLVICTDNKKDIRLYFYSDDGRWEHAGYWTNEEMDCNLNRGGWRLVASNGT